MNELNRVSFMSKCMMILLMIKKLKIVSDLASEIIMILMVWNDMQITEYDYKHNE